MHLGFPQGSRFNWYWHCLGDSQVSPGDCMGEKSPLWAPPGKGLLASAFCLALVKLLTWDQRSSGDLPFTFIHVLNRVFGLTVVWTAGCWEGHVQRQKRQTWPWMLAVPGASGLSMSHEQGSRSPQKELTVFPSPQFHPRLPAPSFAAYYGRWAVMVMEEAG